MGIREKWRSKVEDIKADMAMRKEYGRVKDFERKQAYKEAELQAIREKASRDARFRVLGAQRVPRYARPRYARPPKRLRGSAATRRSLSGFGSGTWTLLPEPQKNKKRKDGLWW